MHVKFVHLNYVCFCDELLEYFVMMAGTVLKGTVCAILGRKFVFNVLRHLAVFGSHMAHKSQPHLKTRPNSFPVNYLVTKALP